MSMAHKKKINISLLVPFLVMLLVFGLLIWQKYRDSSDLPKAPPATDLQGSRKIILFFTGEGPRLVREAREIDACGELDGCLRSVLDELFNGSLGEHGEAIPEGASINSLHVEGDLAVVDLNQEFAEELLSGSSAEMLAVYSIVNTIAVNFPQVTRVRLTLDGNEKASLRHLDLTEPLEPDYTMEQERPGGVDNTPGTDNHTQKGKP